jgi:hypothetical protein
MRTPGCVQGHLSRASLNNIDGSTMILGAARIRQSDASGATSDPRPVQPLHRVHRDLSRHTHTRVPYGARGQVVMNHISKAMFLPNNLERDTAIRVPAE